MLSSKKKNLTMHAQLHISWCDSHKECHGFRKVKRLKEPSNISYLPDEQLQRRDRENKKRHIEAALAIVVRGVSEIL